MKFFFWPIIITLISFAGTHRAGAQNTTAFTYQGQLLESGTNAIGPCTMIFKLYDAASAGNQIGGGITNSPAFANGLFTVNLDFGNVFNGGALWLDITITNGVVTQTLSPRVQVLPTPYAVFAGATSNLNGSLPAGGLSGTYTNPVTFNNGSQNNFNGAFNGSFNGAGAGTFTGDGSGLANVRSIPDLQVFTNNGTFAVPTNVVKIMVEVWGGGGGGGAAPSNVGGGGGGGGGYARGTLYVTPGSNYVVMVGGAGAGSATNGSGGNGGSSSFGGLISATGGAGGTDGISNFGYGGAGGTGQGEDQIIGGNGTTGMSGPGGVSGGASGRGGSGGQTRYSQSTQGNAPGGGGAGGIYGGGAAGAIGRVEVLY